MLSSLGTNFVILKHNTQNLLEKARLYNELAAWFQRGNICEDMLFFDEVQLVYDEI